MTHCGIDGYSRLIVYLSAKVIIDQQLCVIYSWKQHKDMVYHHVCGVIKELRTALLHTTCCIIVDLTEGTSLSEALSITNGLRDYGKTCIDAALSFSTSCLLHGTSQSSTSSQ